METLNDVLNSLEGLSEIELFVIDLFCGAGGLSEGVEEALLNGKKCAKVVCCVNHDRNAILSHNANIPDALHFIEDIRTLELSPIRAIVDRIRELYPDSKIMLHASLECTNFSKAKGGQPRDADSRTLAEHLFRYIDVIDPDYIQIENVEEFMSWGPMDEKGKPLSMRKGEDYTRWVDKVQYGYLPCKWYKQKRHDELFHTFKNGGLLDKIYNFDHRILNAADFGAYTTRKRFFGIFAKKGLPIVFPDPTHCKEGRQDMFTRLEKWRPVKEVLDFSDEGTTIFRDKPLAEKTLERIYAGLIKFVAGGKDSFLSRYNTVRPQDTCKSVDEPCGVLTTENRFAKVQVSFLSKQFSGHPASKNISIDEPAGAITCVDHHAFVSAYYGGKDHNSSVDVPAPTLTTKDRFALVDIRFMCSYNFNDAGKDINEPCPTILTKDRFSLVSPFFMNQYSGGDVNAPCFTLIARMDKMPPYLAECTTEPTSDIPSFIRIEGNVVIYEIYDTDSPMTVKIKEFMALYGIVDIKMRMLRIPELKRIMGFPEDYKLIGTQADQKKFIGNAVEVTQARRNTEALCRKLREIREKKLKNVA